MQSQKANNKKKQHTTTIISSSHLWGRWGHFSSYKKKYWLYSIFFLNQTIIVLHILFFF